MPVMNIVGLIAALLIGAGLGYYLRVIHSLSKKKSIEMDIKAAQLTAEEKALKIVEKAEAKVEAFEREKKEEYKENNWKGIYK